MTSNPVHQILSRVKQTIHHRHMILPGEQLGVAVSGGIDSVVLMDILASLREELQISLMVLHLNHGIRGEEAERDKRFVQDLSKRYTLPFLAKKVDVPGYMREASLSLQEAARELRYRFFAEAMETHDLNKVALGQSADDQAETVLMRFIKGGGTRGLTGIPYIREGRYIRPLLDIWRKELQGYAEQKGLTFVQDSSNQKRTYLRNRIRHELLPYLREYNPSIKERLRQLAQIMGEDDLYLEELAQEVTEGIVKGEREVSIAIPQLLSLPSALQVRVLQRSFAHISSGTILGYPHLKGILRMVQQGGGSKRITLPRGLGAERVYDTLILRTGGGTKEAGVKETTLHVPGRTSLDDLGMAIEATICEGGAPLHPNPSEAYLDCDRLIFPLRLRSYRPGDSFIPLGMEGRKKLKEFFIDLKIPRAQRGKIPLVISGSDICWVTGWRIDERFKIGKETKKILKLTMMSL